MTTTPPPSAMPRSLAVALMFTDLSILAYWTLSALFQTGVVAIPASWMYSGFNQPRVIAWNWSFLPLDLAFSALGLSAVQMARRGNAVWRPLALLSLAFTVAAGGMAIGYWAILGEFEPTWFLPNLTLVIWPLLFLPRLVGDVAKGAAAA